MIIRGLSRALSLTFGPAVALTSRLRYAQKFAVVGLVLLVPMGSVAMAYVSQQQKEITHSKQELLGIELIAPLTMLTGKVVKARHDVILGIQPQLTADLDQMEALERRLGKAIGTSQDWLAARHIVENAEQTEGDLVTRYEAYNAAVDALLGLIVLVGDESGLTLDPDLDSYYLMEILQFRLPVLLDLAGRAGDVAASPNAAPLVAGSDVFIELGVYNGVLTTTHKGVTRAVHTIDELTADPEVRRIALEHFGRLNLVTRGLDETLRSAVQSRRVGVGLADGAETVQGEVIGFAADATTALERLLHTRIDNLSSRANWVELVGGLAALLAIYLFVGFYLSVASPIRHMVATLSCVAGGDLTRRVDIHTHDELSLVARALNETIEQTEIATNRLSRQATHDTLTGLPNRAAVLDRLDGALARTRSGAAPPVAVLFIDLDGFKAINDTLGHASGDAVLRTVAERLTTVLRPGDLVARLAGDEFVVISEGLDKMDDTIRVAERVVDEVRRPITIPTANGERSVGVGASVGIAFADGRRTSSPDELLRDADAAMYRAKARGRGRVEIFDDVMRSAAQSHEETREELRRAIGDDQIVVYYQPIVDIAVGKVVGFEALARWAHPTRGLVGAPELVRLAEETELITVLGTVVLAEACGQAVRWRATGPDNAGLRVTVNVSATQFSDPSFVATVAAILADTGLDPDALWLEITETCIVAETPMIRATVEAIDALGVHLAIDDFGAGYTSLAHLRRLPVSGVKIDGSFVAGLGQDPQDEAIVAAVVGLADALRLLVVVEGVETAEQVEHLRRLGCTRLQGYHFGRPAPAGQALDSAVELGRRLTAASRLSLI